MSSFTRREFVAAAGGAPLLAGAAPQDAPPMRLAMLGMWHSHAEGIVRRVAENPTEFSLVGCWDSDPETAARRRKQWEGLMPGLRLFDSPERLLDEKLDGVVVDGRVYENLKHARMALESGRPVMLEKPAGDNLEEHRKLIELARARKLHVQMIYLFRYMSAVEEMLGRARRGELGRLYEFRARLAKDLAGYARNVEECGRYKGGIFFEMAGHAIDLMVALLGKPATVRPILAHHHAGEPASFIDNGMALFGFERALAVVGVPALETVPHQRRVELFGTGGACVIPHLGSGHLPNRAVQPIDVCKAGAGAWERLELPAATLQIRDLREFAAVVAGRKRPDFDFEHDLAVQETLLKACGM
jgi:predicted dehydrogenase